ncbi:hypothetical protein [Paracoccus sp. TOH]|uniref:hypothetical protein n=1 Tax=Paracoccus sp. TOH TaxID=1263728 RepID=UPI0025AED66B|nr:hypothetical protein [Paracoccus sp. TOH]WJS86012.1 hypothetical protein NBE95_11425 [Paracoccus sp. TOH]
MRELILIRTHFYCEATERFYNYLKSTSNRDIAFVCDETNGNVDVGCGKVKISISADTIREMGLYVPSNFGWLCGDYFIYAASQLLRGYDRYWLLESDVRLSMSSSANFFDAFSEDFSDIFAFHVYKAKSNWYWYKPMSHFECDVYACLFPFIGITRAAADFAFSARKEISKTFDGVVPRSERRRWPNDESFLMTTLMANGFTCRNMNDGAIKYITGETFGVGLPKSDIRLSKQDPDGMIYHPVHFSERFTAKADRWLTTYIKSKATAEKMRDVFTQEFMDDFRAESNEQEFALFRERLHKAIEDSSKSC